MREREQGRKEEKGGKVDMKKVASFPSVLFGGAISFGLFFCHQKHEEAGRPSPS